MSFLTTRFLWATPKRVDPRSEREGESWKAKQGETLQKLLGSAQLRWPVTRQLKPKSYVRLSDRAAKLAKPIQLSLLSFSFFLSFSLSLTLLPQSSSFIKNKTVQYLQRLSVSCQLLFHPSDQTIHQIYGPDVSLYLLHEDTGHPQLPKVKLAQKAHISVQVRSSVSDAVPMVPRGWDIGPTSPMGPSPWPSWNARSHGHLHQEQPLYIHTYIHYCCLG